MNNKLWLLLLFVSCANARPWWESLIGGMASVVGGIPYLSKPNAPEDAVLTITGLANKYGYPLDTHTVITQDGYIINFHRMNKNESSDKVVFLMHGIWECSDSWLLQGPNKSLAYILADEGYDVWLGNARGNRYAKSHTTLNTKMSEYWAFTWEEIGLYDLPAMVDYVLNLTGVKKIYYVGFSQGTTSFFVMNSMKPEYNKKIKLMFGLAPEAFMGNAKNILVKIFSPMQSFLSYFLWNFNVYSLSTDFFNWISPFVCNVLPIGCDNLFFTIVGPNNVNNNLWPIILGHVPTGTSTLQLVHYGQLANSRRFCRFDFGKKENTRVYGKTIPPDYNLTSVTTPMILFYSGNDWFCDRSDVDQLTSYLPNVYGEYFIDLFTHVDFMYADEASTLIYSNIVKHIRFDNR